MVAAANGANTTAVFAGIDPRSGDGYVYLETLGGGMGARPVKDGKDGVQVHIIGAKFLAANIIGKSFWVTFVRRAIATRPRCFDDDGIFGRNDDIRWLSSRRLVSPVASRRKNRPDASALPPNKPHG